jgi:hypothetical protein
MSAPLRPRRAAGVLLGTVTAAALVAGCGGGDAAAGGSAAASGPATVHPAAASSTSAGPALAAGLLPADAFGAQAKVAALDLAQLRQKAAALNGMSAALSGVQIEPPECAAALQALQPDLGGIDDATATVASGQGTTTVEALVSGGPAASAVAGVRSLLASCAHVQVRAPGFGEAAVAVEEVPTGTLADGAAAARVTVTVTRPDSPAMTVPALLGAVQDSGRLLLLATVAGDGIPPEEAAFTSLLQKAVSTEQKALD